MTMHAAKGLEAAVVFLIGGANDSASGPLSVYHQQGERRAWQGVVPKLLREEVEREQRGEDERLLYVALTRARARMVLPQFIAIDKSGESGPANLSGAYGPLNERLWHLLQGEIDPALFEMKALPTALGADAALVQTGTQHAALANWQPPPLLQPDARHESGHLRAIARSRTGALVTSYSQLARGAKQEPLEVDKQEAMRETHDAQTSAGALVSSNVVGNFLHDALELLDLARVSTMPSAETFASSESMRALVEPLADRAGIALAQRPHAYRLLFAAVRCPIPIGPFGRVPCIAALAKVLRETEFLFPIPERNHRLLGAPRDGAEEPFAVGRGFVKGFIDVLFEHEGRVYFGDWKSSVVRDASPAALSSYIASHFHWQIVVYSVAVLRMLDIHDEAAYERRFGGLLYFFLRNMEATPPGAETQGTWFERPDWTTVKQWERELLQHSFAREERTP
jgi:exodeoxyribonuclease V beta subunit